jgi:hypothetical protein
VIVRSAPVTVAATFALSLAAIGLSLQHLDAQAPVRPGATDAVPRTAEGRPDLTGIYDAATMTPLTRPAEFGNRRALTPAESAEMERYERELQEKGNEPDSADRALPPVGGDTSQTKSFLEAMFRAGGGVVGGYNTFWISPGSTVAEVNGEKRTSIVIDPPDGRIPAMKPEARRRNMALRGNGSIAPDAGEAAAASGPASAYDAPELRPLSERCLLGFGSTAGPPALPNYWYNNLKQIVQTRDSVMILNEMVHDARVVRIGGRHLPPSYRKWMGDSIGHWEGDTLVVDTTNFTDKTQFQGSSDQLHVVERFTKLPDGNVLYRFTVEDPATWDRPWTGEYPWRATDEMLFEYACHEGNYSMSNVLSGARARERDDARGTARER